MNNVVVIVAATRSGNELYDRRRDPYQLDNLIDGNPKVAEELFRKMRDFMLELKNK